MILNFDTVFILVGFLVSLFAVTAVILTAPDAKHPKHSNSK